LQPVSGKRLELLTGERSHPSHRLGPRRRQRHARRHELAIPHLEVGRLTTPFPLLEEPVALPEDPLVRARRRLPSRPQRGNSLIQEPPPSVRVTLHHFEIAWSEEHAPSHAPDVSSPPERRAVDMDPVGPDGPDLHLHQGLAHLTLHLAPNVR